MFDNNKFIKYEFKDIPLWRDLHVVDEVYIEEYERKDDWDKIGYVSYMAVNYINQNSIELYWNPHGAIARYHEVHVSLPRDQFVACVASSDRDDKPHIFVKREWLKYIHRRAYSIFALIDAIGVKEALKTGSIRREDLVKLRDKIDSAAKAYPDIAFISFSDNIMLKSHWTVGDFRSDIKYTYEPEVFIRLADKINDICKKTLGLSTYAIITQGSNEYYDDPPLHISESKNHISFNSLGAPFAQLFAIDSAAREAIKNGCHDEAELYLDAQYYRSLKFQFEFAMHKKQHMPNYRYQTKMLRNNCKYFISSRKDILDNLQDEAGQVKI